VEEGAVEAGGRHFLRRFRLVNLSWLGAGQERSTETKWAALRNPISLSVSITEFFRRLLQPARALRGRVLAIEAILRHIGIFLQISSCTIYIWFPYLGNWFPYLGNLQMSCDFGVVWKSPSLWAGSSYDRNFCKYLANEAHRQSTTCVSATRYNDVNISGAQHYI
jgi:hypothetical protein